jgi:hypothetical protein
MQTIADPFESLRARLTASGLLSNVALSAAATGRWRADGQLSKAGHELVATSGAEAALQALDGAAGTNPGGAIEWRFSTGGADPWPGDMPPDARIRPRLWSWQANGDRHFFLVDVTEDLAWLDGHFPGAPILAGVVQLHWAAMLARGVFGLAAFPRDIVRLKFQRPVLPPALLELGLQRIDEHNVQFHFRSPGCAHSQGRLLFGTEAA